MNILIEIFKRLLANTPSLFKWVRAIGWITAFVTGLPVLLANSGIELPESWQAIQSTVISVAGLVAGFVAQLTATTAEKANKSIPD